MDFLISIIFAFSGGILPAIIWLLFWLREDGKHPEPNKLLILTFLFGMMAVPVVFAVQFLLDSIFFGSQDIRVTFRLSYTTAIATLIVWATVEEFAKYLAAYFGGLSKKENDEPIDPMIYMITGALGFAALENTLFLFSPLLAGDTISAFITGNMRFIGATLLHVASSAIVGVFLSLSYFKSKKKKKRYLITGLVLAIALHTIFNSFIIRSGTFTIIGFSMVWFTVVLIISLFEKVKKVK